VSTQEDVNRAVSAAKAAFPSWSKLSQDERAGYLNKLADAAEANLEELTKLLGREAGKPPQAANFEASSVARLAREISKLRLKEETIIDDGDVRCLPILVFANSMTFNYTNLAHVANHYSALRPPRCWCWHCAVELSPRLRC
jgi:acyl-CoA reductase-like NAD-dependent aldehyde dehydrogenase